MWMDWDFYLVVCLDTYFLTSSENGTFAQFIKCLDTASGSLTRSSYLTTLTLSSPNVAKSLWYSAWASARSLQCILGLLQSVSLHQLTPSLIQMWNRNKVKSKSSNTIYLLAIVALGSLTRSRALSIRLFSKSCSALFMGNLTIFITREGKIWQNGAIKAGFQQSRERHQRHSFELRTKPTLFILSWFKYELMFKKLHFTSDSNLSSIFKCSLTYSNLTIDINKHYTKSNYVW